LDVVARRPIKKDEQITMDYATFCVDMNEFVCQCGSSNCRKVIKGTDYLEPWVETLYGDHISDYVRTKRRERERERANRKLNINNIVNGPWNSITNISTNNSTRESSLNYNS
jgi:hypothetical protein